MDYKYKYKLAFSKNQNFLIIMLTCGKLAVLTESKNYIKLNQHCNLIASCHSFNFWQKNLIFLGLPPACPTANFGAL